eukprot:TRINITY_DN16880_c0_g1_i2.p1 TRINITY_DN16880_c0_g1~~TRINITY_DN16880_c0_g1_i2.p1  ORF type:complete len:546 (-),score=116.29 TRINITY_DN16880_c0_g1_i2:48-1685(-)
MGGVAACSGAGAVCCYRGPSGADYDPGMCRKNPCAENVCEDVRMRFMDSPVNPAVSRKAPVPEPRGIMDSYYVREGPAGILGEGTFAVCRAGVRRDTGRMVAVKIYRPVEIAEEQFHSFLATLRHLHEADADAPETDAGGGEKPWFYGLGIATPADVFLTLLDNSATRAGLPGPDEVDGKFYVITEVADYSLRDYIVCRREHAQPLGEELLLGLARGIVRAAAALHAKQLVHVDIKPENIMIFAGLPKLIDVDGCLPVGSSVSIGTKSVAFSPLYCAPELAQACADAWVPNGVGQGCVAISPALDVWSLGLILCELVTFEPVLREMRSRLSEGAASNREAGLRYLQWLGKVEGVTLPEAVEATCPGLHKLLTEKLVVLKASGRADLLSCLSHSALVSARICRLDSTLRRCASREQLDAAAGALPEATSDPGCARMRGDLCKLDVASSSGGAAEEAAAERWLEREVYIAEARLRYRNLRTEAFARGACGGARTSSWHLPTFWLLRPSSNVLGVRAVPTSSRLSRGSQRFQFRSLRVTLPSKLSVGD